MRIFLYISVLLGFLACEQAKDPVAMPLTAEAVEGKWMLYDRFTLDSVSVCEKQEYYIFNLADSTVLRHQECLPKSNTYGTWKVSNDTLYVFINIVQNNVQIASLSEPLKCVLISDNTFQTNRSYFGVQLWSKYQKVPL